MIRRRPHPVVSPVVAAFFGIAVAVACLVLVVPVWPGEDGLSPGDRAPRDLRAIRSAHYVSEPLTELERDRAANSVVPELRPIDPTVRETQSEALDSVLQEVTIVRQSSDLTTQQERLNALAAAPGIQRLSVAGRRALLELSPQRYTAITEALRVGLNNILQTPILDPADAPDAVREYIANVDTRTFDTTEQTALTEVLRSFIEPNVEIDVAATEQAREDARANVGDQTRTYTAGQVVVSEGEVLDEASVEALKATGIIESGFNVHDIGAGVIVAGAFGLLLGAYLYLFQPLPTPVGRPLALVGIIIVASLASVRLAVPSLIPDVDGHYYVFALPIATAAMTAAAFTDLQFGAVVAAGVGMFAAFIAATAPELAGASFITPLESLELAVVYTAGGMAGAAVVFRADRLSRFAFSAIAVGVATGGILVAFWLLDQNRESAELGWIATASATNGIGAAVLTVGVFVLLSHVLGVTTRLQLLELAQANSPLLRRLQDEAPGTYHHSMLVGALAERAAEQVGADPLVTRAGAYYHDIGKLVQPQYYIENIFPGATSPHEDLPPGESARFIREHVTNGLDLAKKHRLPGIVRDFIPQHHGTRLVAYFYRQAKQDGLAPDPEDYRYPGPRPRTKESAIVMLADSCEAVVRAGRQSDMEEIGNSVDSVFAERLAEGQLDDCDITMREVSVVAESFKSTLRAVYHQRIEYPAADSDPIALRAIDDQSTEATAVASD